MQSPLSLDVVQQLGWVKTHDSRQACQYQSAATNDRGHSTILIDDEEGNSECRSMFSKSVKEMIKEFPPLWDDKTVETLNIDRVRLEYVLIETMNEPLNWEMAINRLSIYRDPVLDFTTQTAILPIETDYVDTTLIVIPYKHSGGMLTESDFNTLYISFIQKLDEILQ